MHVKSFIRLKLILCLSVTGLWAQSGQPFKFPYGEKLTYRVDWSLVRLGTITLQHMGDDTLHGRPVHHIHLQLDSNPLLFFINLHTSYDCYLDSLMQPVRYISQEKEHNQPLVCTYDFYPQDSLYTFRKNAGMIRKIPTTEPLFDEISLTYYTRKELGRCGESRVTAYMDTNRGPILFRWTPNLKETKFAGRKQQTYFVSGEIKMEGIAGVSGPFEGWFSADSARVPFKANLKVFVGKVRVELERDD